MGSSSGSAVFTIPKAFFLEHHLVENPGAWPPTAAAAIAQDLSSAIIQADGGIDLAGHERVLEEAHRAHFLVQDCLRLEQDVPYIAPQSKRPLLGPLPGYILRTIMPSASIHFDAAYARGVHPCCSRLSTTRVLPKSGVATSLVTVTVELHEADEATLTMPAVVSLGEDLVKGNLDTSQTTSTADELSNAPSKDSSTDLYGDDYSFVSEEDDPLSQAHLLPTYPSRTEVSFPIICVAGHEEIYEVLGSALFQRRVLGVLEPLLGFTFEPYACYLQMLVAWLAPCTVGEHDCVQVHIAHAPSPGPAKEGTTGGGSFNNIPALQCGIFDIASICGTTALALFLERQQPALSRAVQTAQKHAAHVSSILLKGHAPMWRVDSNANRRDTTFRRRPSSPTSERVRRWLAECRTPASVPPDDMADECIGSASSQASPLQVPSASGRSSHPKPTSDTDAASAEYVKAHESQPRCSASILASVQGLNSPSPSSATAILIDRFVTVLSWPPAHDLYAYWPSWSMFKMLHQNLLSRVLFAMPGDAEIVPRYSQRGRASGAVGGRLDSAKLGEPRRNVVLDEEDRSALEELTRLNQLEQHILGAFQDSIGLTWVSDTVNELFLSVVHDVRTLSEDVKIRRRDLPHANDSTEARIYWDWMQRVIFVFARTADTDYVLERESPLSRNDVYDHVHAVRQRTSQEGRDMPAENAILSYARNQYHSGYTAWVPPLPKNGPKFSQHRGQDESDRDALHAMRINHDALVDSRDESLTMLVRATAAWRERTDLIDLQARVVRSPDNTRFDAGAIFLLPDVFPTSDIGRVSDFSFITSSATASNQTALDDATVAFEDQAADETSPVLLEYETWFDRARKLRKGDHTLPPTTTDSHPPSGAGNKGGPGATFSSKNQSRPGAVSKESNALLPLIVLYIVFQYKRPSSDLRTVLNQTRIILTSNVKYLGSIGITKLPVFGIVVEGYVGYLLVAWGETDNGRYEVTDPPVTLVHIADTNCPHWDLSDTPQALRLCLFLFTLREAWWDLLCHMFGEVRAEFLRRWGSEDTDVRETLNWKARHQRESHLVTKTGKDMQAEEDDASLTQQPLECAKAEDHGSG